MYFGYVELKKAQRVVHNRRHGVDATEALLVQARIHAVAHLPPAAWEVGKPSWSDPFEPGRTI